jgi:hypothetical protein
MGSKIDQWLNECIEKRQQKMDLIIRSVLES